METLYRLVPLWGKPAYLEPVDEYYQWRKKRYPSLVDKELFWVRQLLGKLKKEIQLIRIDEVDSFLTEISDTQYERERVRKCLSNFFSFHHARKKMCIGREAFAKIRKIDV